MRSVVRKVMLLMLPLALAGVSSVPAQARPAAGAPAPTAGLKIGFVNGQALLRGMPGFAQAESTYAKEAQAAQTELTRLQAAWDSALAQFQQSQAMMTPSNRTARERQLQAQRDTLNSRVQALNAKVNAKERELLGPMQDRLRAVIDGLRAEGNYAVIIDLSSDAAGWIIAYDKSLDLTLRVAERLAAPSN